MQNHDSRQDSHSASYVSQSSCKVAIPRLARPERQPTKQQFRHRDRVQRACRNCHKRKVKCSGGFPRCNFCEKVNKPCIYEATRKDRLANATDRNDHLVALLKDLSVRVDDEDRARIESALNIDSDEEDEPPEPSSASRSRFPTTPLSQLSDFSHRPSGSQSSAALYTADTEATSSAPDTHPSSGRHEPKYNLDSLFDDASPAPNALEAVYLGQICEVQWLRKLRRHLLHEDALLMSPQLSIDTNFYSDDDGVQLLLQDNPFHLPSQELAMEFFECYVHTVHVTFPIIPEDLGNNLKVYFQSMRSAHVIDFPQRWYGIVNLVLAIGARFSRLINAEWHSNATDENLYISRACQLLGLGDSSLVLTTPDLSLVQAHGLLAFYYMAIGHVNRAWVLIGTALRLALALGYHAHSQTSHTDPHRQSVVAQTWWSLHNLEGLLSSMTGRPSMVRSDEITTPLPSDVAERGSRHEDQRMPFMSYADAQVRIAVITQEVLSKLYTERRAARSWAQMHAIITSMMSELDEWAIEAVQPQEQEPRPLTEQDVQQIMLRKLYCRTKMFITRPSLRRIERCSEADTEEFDSFDREAAEACIKTAQEFTSLLPRDLNLKSVYEQGPWWVLMHNIMQAFAILLIGISCRRHFDASYDSSVASAKSLITWLQYMRDGNDTAKRAYQVAYDIVKDPHLADPFVWADLVDAFPDELQTSIHHAHDTQAYLWPGEGPSVPNPFGYAEDTYGFQH
ncbi:hypothetical protein HBI24_125950 [Parastagonospora nodorum]|nr:hypothetical protein HBH53_083490 [Parastagonospora nodorum]KAH5433915.1 hypothetical protein HBI47_086770 [Parastagonospora nodorum]KAH5581649.1 hypothetical protein HBI24_125950 [Parastagonospora nodorum]KAH5701913.1 hypothetical protein HBI44_032670 [Parastagonospora nodorum]KAH6266673.1 hypothetical protein HBI41_105240 [Parastagonospora nodorum]